MTELRLPCPGEAAPGAAGRPLRIVVPALWYFPEHPSGSSRLAYDEAKYLAEIGHEVWLVAMDGGTGQPEHVLDGSLHVLRYRRPRWTPLDPTGGHQRVVRRLLSRQVGSEVDLVHAHMLLPGAAAFALYAGRARTCYSLHSPVLAELLATGRGAPVHERLRLRAAGLVRSRLERRLLAQCDAVTCDSEFTRQLVARLHGNAAAARTSVVPGWVDLSRFRVIEDRRAAKRALGWPTDRPVLFCLRRFVPRMGLDALLAAAGRLKASGRAFHLVLAGDGELRPALRARADSLGLGACVDFPGVVPGDRLPTMYGAADAFVLPTAALECFGLIAIEALACGRPVLATPVGAIPEVLEAIEPRWLARDTSVEALAALLGDYLDGRIPAPAAGELHAFVDRRYAASRRLPELAALALGLALFAPAREGG